MGRKAKKLKELCDIFTENETIDIESGDLSTLRELVEKLGEISDERHESYISHKLSDIIMITLLAILANANEWCEIEAFGRKKESWLRTFLELRNGIPSDDTIRIVISSLNSKYLYGIVIDFLISKVNGILEGFEKKETNEKTIISCDGKTSCASKRKETDESGSKALHTLNAYSSDYGICIGQEFVDEKTNEITAMPTLLKSLDLRDAIVTWDALNTQKDIVSTVIQGKGDYVGALKGNQHNFYEDVRDYFDDEVIKKLKEDKKNYSKTTEKEHSAVVTREYFITNDIKWLYAREKWEGLKAIGCEHKIITKNNPNIQPIHEYRYFICSINEIGDFSRAVRDHWGVENGLHWHLDFTFKDDKNTTMKENGAKNLQIFKKLALAMLKMVQVIYPKRTSLKMIRYLLSLSFDEEIERIFKMLNVDNLKGLDKM